MNRRRQGFTLLEAILVLSIASTLAVLIGLVLGQVRNTLLQSNVENRHWAELYRLTVSLRSDMHTHGTASIDDEGNLTIGNLISYRRAGVDRLIRETGQLRDVYSANETQWSVSEDGFSVTVDVDGVPVVATAQSGATR